MDYGLFWQLNPRLLKPFFKAAQRRFEQDNRVAWLQGMYFYEALLDASPAIKAFAKGKPRQYRSEPYPIGELAAREQEERKQQKANEVAKIKMQEFAFAFNQQKRGEAGK
ncbi:hypothetical protein LI291_10770 [Intestinibacillus massiliensis]|nr:hypothetical protein [Intestinibacillus massiliensis]